MYQPSGYLLSQTHLLVASLNMVFTIQETGEIAPHTAIEVHAPLSEQYRRFCSFACFRTRGGEGYWILFRHGAKLYFAPVLLHFRTKDKRKQIKAQSESKIVGK